MFSAFNSRDALYEVMELCTGGSLFELLDSRHNHRLSECELRGTTKSLVDALIYLRNERVIHRDIRPPNILITEYGRVVSTYLDFNRLMSANIIALIKEIIKLRRRDSAIFRILYHNVELLQLAKLCFSVRLLEIRIHDHFSFELVREIALLKPYSFSTDVWSLGCVALTCLSGTPPFEVSIPSLFV